MKKAAITIFVILGIVFTGLTTMSVIGSDTIFSGYTGFHHRGVNHHSYNEDYHMNYQNYESYEWMYLHLSDEQREIVDSEYALRISEVDFNELDETQTNEAVQSVKEAMIVYIETNITDFSGDDYPYEYGCPFH